MSNQSNPLKRFISLAIMLFFIVVGLVILWQHRSSIFPTKMTQQELEATAQRIAPVGAVYVGEAGTQSLEAVAAGAAELLQRQQSGGAYDGTMDGAVIWDKLCSTCHATGANFSPVLTHAQWDSRIAQGKETLYEHAINGYQSDPNNPAQVMQPKGGNPALTDDQVKAAVDWMLEQIQ